MLVDIIQSTENKQEENTFVLSSWARPSIFCCPQTSESLVLKLFDLDWDLDTIPCLWDLQVWTGTTHPAFLASSLQVKIVWHFCLHNCGESILHNETFVSIHVYPVVFASLETPPPPPPLIQLSCESAFYSKTWKSLSVDQDKGKSKGREVGNRVNMGMKEWDRFRMFLKLDTKMLEYDARDKTSMAGWGTWTEKLER